MKLISNSLDPITDTREIAYQSSDRDSVTWTLAMPSLGHRLLLFAMAAACGLGLSQIIWLAAHDTLLIVSTVLAMGSGFAGLWSG